jgi:hypothetical protein
VWFLIRPSPSTVQRLTPSIENGEPSAGDSTPCSRSGPSQVPAHTHSAVKPSECSLTSVNVTVQRGENCR